MRAACLIALLLATATAQARTLGGDLLFSTDTDDNDIRRTTVNGWEAVSEQLDLGASLKDHVKSSVGAWKYPRWIEVRESLPKTATGKIQRFKLRDEA